MATFVLVHGTWHGGWCWAPVARRLSERGHAAFAPTMPGHALDAERVGINNEHCADALVAFIQQRDLHDVILVGHSWGGTLLSAVAPRLVNRLQRLVYASAFVLEPGESQLDVLPPDYVGLFEKLAASTPDRSLPPPAFEIWQEAFMQDAGAEAQRLAHNLLSPSPFGCWETKNAVAVRDLDVAKSYINPRHDISLPPGEFAWLPRFANRLGEHRFVETDGSHEACFTRPVGLADTLLEASELD
ncbi:MAG: alpha/beta fold hydrolase [Actinomycetota bacterium]|nr:alpha/beta fold hydrolase [Actinomycetota bacterium]